MTRRNDGLLRFSGTDTSDGLMQSVQTRGTRGINGEAGPAEIEVVGYATRHDGLVVAGGVKHGSVLQVAQSAEPVVRSVPADKDSNFLADEPFLWDTGILDSLVCTFQEQPLLWICARLSVFTGDSVRGKDGERNTPMASASCWVMLKKGASNAAASWPRKYPPRVLKAPRLAGFGCW